MVVEEHVLAARAFLEAADQEFGATFYRAQKSCGVRHRMQ